MGMKRGPKWSIATIALAVVAATASASPAGAAVTIGQLVTVPGGCADNNDWVQESVASGNTYVVPGNGTITSWSHNAGAGAGQTMTMKIWRHVVGPTYTVVGHDGPRTLTQGFLNIFPTSLQVQAGDVLGLHTGTGSPACVSAITPGDSILNGGGNAVDGGSLSFPSTLLRHLNITAAFVPSNSFTFGEVKRNKKKGTATLSVEVPNPGTLVLGGKGVKGASAGAAVVSKAVGAPGTVKLLIRAKGKQAKRLKRQGKLGLKAKITYTPTGGAASTQTLKLTLKKQRKRPKQ
jgi:hypothetical protein